MSKTMTKPKKATRVHRMFELVLAGHTNDSAVPVILKEYAAEIRKDGKKTTSASIAWCRAQLMAKTDYAKKHNPKGLKAMTSAEAAEKGKKPKKPAVAPAN